MLNSATKHFSTAKRKWSDRITNSTASQTLLRCAACKSIII